MEMEGNTLAIALLIVGLVVGAGGGYFLAPNETVVFEETQQATGDSLLTGFSMFTNTILILTSVIAVYNLYENWRQRIMLEELQKHVRQSE